VEKSKFYPRLESARGVAALLVAAFHVGLTPYLYEGRQSLDVLIHPEIAKTFGQSLAAYTYRLLANGGVLPPMVLFFFVLSGFVLTASLQRTRSQPPLRSATTFLVSRFFRIFPAAAMTVAVFSALYFAFGLRLGPASYSLWNVIANALLLSSDMNGVMWSLQAEIIGSVLILFVSLLVDATGRWVAIALCIALAMFSMNELAYNTLVPEDGIPRLAYLHTFIFGSAVSYFREELTAVISRCGTIKILTLSVFLFIMIVPIVTGTLSPQKGELYSAAIIVQAASAALIIAVIAYGDSAPTSVLDSAILRFYGKISFSLYLLHPITLIFLWSNYNAANAMPRYMWGLVNTGMPLPAIALMLSVITIAAVTPFAYLMWRFVEKPASRLGRLSGLPSTMVVSWKS
jgi:peptidoglycan/LPS O-acetylase OafA/YrhL